jgi:hypothetical protein
LVYHQYLTEKKIILVFYFWLWKMNLRQYNELVMKSLYTELWFILWPSHKQYLIESNLDVPL